MEAVECGAAALGILLAYFGRNVPLAELRQRCGVSRDGSKASNVVKAARTYGLEAKGFSKSLESLRELDFPFIVFWQFNHFLVVEGHDQHRVYLNDPALGHRKVTWDEFDAGFTGVVLVMKPGPAFIPGGTLPSVPRRLLDRMRGNYATLVFVALVGLLLVLPGLAIPAYARIYIDSVILEARYDMFRPLIIVMIGTVLLQLSLVAVQQFYIRRLQLSMGARMNSQYFWHLLRLPVSFYTQRYPGEIVQRMELNTKLSGVLAGQFIAIVISLFTMILYGTVLMLIHWQLTIMATLFAMGSLLYLAWISRRRVEANIRYSQEAGKAAGFSIAGIQSIETMKASGLEDDFFGKWMGFYANSSNAGQELHRASLFSETLPLITGSLTSAVVLVIGGYHVIQGQMSIGTLVAFQGLMLTYLAPVTQLTQMSATLQELRGDLLRLDDVLANPVAPPFTEMFNSDQQSPSQLRLTGQVELRDVTFGYSPLEPPLIKLLSLTIRPGQRVALVGGSGSGKSTVAKLICGLYEPWSGDIRFDGLPRQAWPLDVLSNSLSFVEQDILLFEGPVRDNLTLWDKTIGDSALDRACRDAHIQDVVSNLPGVYDGKLIEGGANLSGGQRQRLEIARALVTDPSILVIDEGTSALDAETEAIIDANLRRRGCTCVIIAHRLSTIRDADEIIVLEQGVVVERGTHEQLWQQGGRYAALLRHQDTVETSLLTT
jgi:ATP-binding cassette subfamily C protein